MSRSHIITAALTGIVGLLIQTFGLPIAPDEADAFVAIALQLGTYLYIWYRRYTEGDVTIMGARKW